MKYRIADFVIDFSGPLPTEDRIPWSLFRCEDSSPVDYTVDCHYVDILPKGDPALTYYDPLFMRDYAVAQEQDSCLRLSILKDVAPWGHQLHQLYEEIALPHILLQGKKIVIHSSYIETPMGAILFTAPSGTGKTTQAELWKKHRGAVILNGDRSVLGLSHGKRMVFGYPISGSSEDCENRSLPLCAVVALKQAPENTVRRLRGRDALRVLLNGTYYNKRFPQDVSLNMEAALPFLETPIFELSCRPDLGAVEALEQAILASSQE